MLLRSSTSSYSVEEFVIVLNEEELSSVVVPFVHLLHTLNHQSPSAYFKQLSAGLNVGPETALGETLEVALKHYIAQHREESQIDYDSVGTFVCYDRTYFYRNLAKCLIASLFANDHIAIPEKTTRAIDLGSGVGTFSLALNFFPKFKQLQYVLVDSAEYQLALAEALFKQLHFQNISYCHQGVYAALLKRGLRISSYWLCGNRTAVENLSDKDVQLLFRDGLILIDYQKNLDFLVDRVKLLSRRLRRLELRCKLPITIAKELGDNLISVHLLLASPAPH